VGATTAEETVQTHDPGERLSWRTGPEISERTGDWQEKRMRMQTICGNCHSPTVMKNHFAQFDKAIALYNHKFAIPAQTILNQLRASGKLDANLFNEPLERIWLFLWHHEGRRARMGVAMMGPDYVQWNGFYEVALGFYFHFIPEAERLQPGITDEIMSRPEHSWYKQTSGTKEEVAVAIRNNVQFWLNTAPEPAAPATGTSRPH
ncbi:MAG TPA: hypothetical protein PKO06_07890, partial [Candidatus Ozemobacteraceae bacterium]|nr:hypothetical protein [Candidatus Ozemobacteraceae bacterium]